MGRGTTHSNMWTRGLILAAAAILVAVILAGHEFVPNAVGNLGSFVETFLPWLGWVLVPIGFGAAVRRSASAGIAAALTLLVWSTMFLALLPDKSNGDGEFRVLTHNVDVDNPDLEGTVDTLLGAQADILALEELDEEDQNRYAEALADEYPYTVRHGTVALWSKFPITSSKPVDIEIGWTRAMQAVVETPTASVAVYVSHLASVRIGSDGFSSQQRDATARALGKIIAAEQLDSVVLLGDLNGTLQDRSLAPLTYQLRSTQAEAGQGFGFTWPASFPMSRIDQILVKNLTPVKSWTLDRTGSDHLPIASELHT